MAADQPLIDSLRKAVEAMPDDVPLRLHLAATLLSAGLRDEGVRHLGAVLQRDPANATALALLQQPGPAADTEPLPGRAGLPAQQGGDYDWSQAESEVADLLPPQFASGAPGPASDEADTDPSSAAFDVERPPTWPGARS